MVSLPTPATSTKNASQAAEPASVYDDAVGLQVGDGQVAAPPQRAAAAPPLVHA